MTNSINRPEILAPCGSYEILIAAVKAGADACYIGGNRFSARAYAPNLMEDEVARAIDYAHLHDTKLYLTINTLVKEGELMDVVDYLLPYYKAGIDAVIVQDLGVFSLVKKHFPDLPIHCSTQMNITSVHAAALMKELGATRVVTAREMQLSEIAKIKENLDIEVETFVHGALCYSYSGQCLMSSLAGGRSGNRGRCAQPCRKCYDSEYVLSMKDLCALPKLPLLLEAGIDSLKIEGRMKNAYYVASAVDAYREIADDIVNDQFDVEKALKYQTKLADVFNRGGFTEGYFFMHNSENMISKTRPNNQGTLAGTVSSVADGKVSIKLAEDLYKADVLEITLKDKSTIEITSPVVGKKSDIVSLSAPKTRFIAVNTPVYRTRCNALLSEIDNDILNIVHKQPINMHFVAKIGEPMILTAYRCDRDDVCAVVEGAIVEQSKNHKIDIESIKDKISQLGDTEYELADLTFDVDEDAFIPMSLVKQLRRDVVSKLDNLLCKTYQREYTEVNEDTVVDAFVNPLQDGYYAMVSSVDQLKAVTKIDINAIFMSREIYDKAYVEGLFDDCNSNFDNIYITLPHIIDSKFDLKKYLPEKIKGIYIRNIDGLACVYKAYKHQSLADLQIIIATSLYTYNKEAALFIKQLIPNAIFEASQELNEKELRDLSHIGIVCVYGHQQVMLSAQCVNKTKGNCNHNKDILTITDDKSNCFYAMCMCDSCYNVVLNGRAMNLLDKLQDVKSATGTNSYMLSFTREDYATTYEIMRYIYDKTLIQNKDIKYTNGHFYRGVE